VRLTRREEEVLDGILRSLANKKIACELNLSERTIKFHVSSLLAKFKVRGRLELMREASRHSLSSIPPAVGGPAPQLGPYEEDRREGYYRHNPNSSKVLPLAGHRMMA
jgi:DNA-binding CsgD family transcriptional regulator